MINTVKNWGFVVLLSFCFMSFAMSQVAADNAISFDELVNLIQNRTYKFNGEWATSQGGRRVKLIEDSNYVIVNKENTIGNLPYYGIISTGGLQNTSEIYFQDTIFDYRVTVKAKAKKIKVKYKVRSQDVLYYVSFTTFSDGNTLLSVTSRVSNALSFEGHIVVL
ncbi:MAG: hypothetical protein BM564_08800 [Bacteroidetes bacterium MedPE-SWsnd-G2]|nr:MAG: hypothetical protein BM564_08800 [Bacteroidetes bacterium MedPE-SWsnd-G2]